MACVVQPRRSARHTASDFNLWGLDPDGRKTHLIQHMYGNWRLPTIPCVRFSGKSLASPRYGPPSSEQIAWLPATFVEHEPPAYYGRPCPPYLPPPVGFDLAALEGLISHPRKGLDIGGANTRIPIPIAPGGEYSVFLKGRAV